MTTAYSLEQSKPLEEPLRDDAEAMAYRAVKNVFTINAGLSKYEKSSTYFMLHDPQHAAAHEIFASLLAGIPKSEVQDPALLAASNNEQAPAKFKIGRVVVEREVHSYSLSELEERANHSSPSYGTRSLQYNPVTATISPELDGQPHGIMYNFSLDTL